ncbi:DUF305 domain-containing protein [Micrococcus sp. TA1]|uniref:DUF305 domain-containing protein n=1 Tax=Micrococcus sp. TA1 TaxID=681627 RepID=UPI0016157CAC|nr:DUF305 domain-containing protein [Micrococcus sp. TA1]MBB5747985.1 uncharacterized protein (DUF305 family) [Micrococcus sp. TA1]
MKRTTTLTGLALAAALALSGCGGTETGGGTETTSAPAATTAEAAPTATDTATSTATGTAEAIDAEHNDADIMFARMMIPHHQQAIQMSEIMLAQQDQDPQIRQLAEQIKAAQGPEIDRMNAMLSAWGQEPMDMGDMGDMGGDMGGMDHGSGSGMSGMMSQEDMQQLEKAQGTEAARLFLDGMIEHHKGAVDMAQEELDNGQNPQAQQLAEEVITAQEAEITEMEQLLQNF